MDAERQDLAIVHFVTDLRFMDADTLRGWVEMAETVTLITPDLPSEPLPAGVDVVQYEPGSSKAGLWNQFIADSETSFTLFLEDDERFEPYHMPDLSQMDARSFFPVRIQTADRGERQIFYQVRFLPNLRSRVSGEVFDGWSIPDATRVVLI